MKIKVSTFIKILSIAIIFICVQFTPITVSSNKVIALLTLGFSLVLLLKSKKNLPVFIAFIFIFYCNYSIILGEYFFASELGVPLFEVKTTLVYGILIRCLFLFTSVLALFYESRALNDWKNLTFYCYNPLFSIVLLMSCIAIGVFAVNRESTSVYSVKITPIYEYARLLFLFAIYYGGRNKLIQKAIFFAVVLFVLQDAYYGGRATSVQLGTIVAFTFFGKYLTARRVVLIVTFGIFFSSGIASYRSNDFRSFSSVFHKLINEKAVLDTATHSYYASATHVAATEVAPVDKRLTSLYEFIRSIFLGSRTKLSNVTDFVKENYFVNVGGGLLPSHFYFWLGWWGVLFIAVFCVTLINRLSFTSGALAQILFISVLVSISRWYLYSPTVLFRGSLFFPVFMYGILNFLHNSVFSVNNRQG